jgi:hypothetical protein
LHKRTFPRHEELVEALKAHGLEHKTPSQLADAFRLGWAAALACPVCKAVPGEQCKDFAGLPMLEAHSMRPLVRL